MYSFLFGFLLGTKALKFWGKFLDLHVNGSKSFMASGDLNIDQNEKWPNYFRMWALIESLFQIFLFLIVFFFVGGDNHFDPSLPPGRRWPWEFPRAPAKLARFLCFATLASGVEEVRSFARFDNTAILKLFPFCVFLWKTSNWCRIRSWKFLVDIFSRFWALEKIREGLQNCPPPPAKRGLRKKSRSQVVVFMVSKFRVCVNLFKNKAL